MYAPTKRFIFIGLEPAICVFTRYKYKTVLLSLVSQRICFMFCVMKVSMTQLFPKTWRYSFIIMSQAKLSSERNNNRSMSKNAASLATFVNIFVKFTIYAYRPTTYNLSTSPRNTDVTRQRYNLA